MIELILFLIGYSIFMTVVFSGVLSIKKGPQ